MTSIALPPPSAAPVSAERPDACAFDRRPARYLVETRGPGMKPGDPAVPILVCLDCWLDLSGSIAGLVGARRLA